MPDVQTTPRTPEIAWPDGRRGPLRLARQPFAEGGDARLFAILGQPDLVAKMYRAPSADPQRRAKLDAMLASPPANVTAEHDGRRSVQLAWPVAVIEDGDDAPLGFAMPRVDLDRAVDLELLLSARGRRAARLTDDYRTRAVVAHNLAAVVAALHAGGDYVIDLKPTNVHVHRGTFFVAMLDCDGFSIGSADGDARFPAHQYTDSYIAPEALRARARPEALGEAQDRFALAVVLFRLLSGGYHPFQGVPQPGADVPTTDSERVAAGLYPYGSSASEVAPPPGSAYPFFDARTQGLFDAAFAPPDGDSTPERPPAAAWQRHLLGLLDDGLSPCPENPEHALFEDRACADCAAALRRPPRLAPSARTGAEPSRAAPTSPGPAGWTRAAAARASAMLNRTVTAAQAGAAVIALLVLGSAGLGYASGWGGDEGTVRDARAVAPPPVTPLPAERMPRSASVETLDALSAEAFMTRAPDEVKRVVSERTRLGFWPEADTAAAPYVSLSQPYTISRPQASLHDRVAPCATSQERLDAVTPVHLMTAVAERDVDMVAALVLYGPTRSLPGGDWAPAARDASGRTALMNAAATCALGAPLSDEVADGIRQAASLYAAEVLEEHRYDEAYGRTDLRIGPDLSRLTDRVPPPAVWTDSTVLRGTAGLPALRDAVRSAAILDMLLIQVRAGIHGNVEARDRWRRTPLMYAAAFGNVQAVRRLLDAGADPGAIDALGVTVLMHAADRVRDKQTDALADATVALLLAAGADPDARSGSRRRAADYVGTVGDGLSTSRTLARLGSGRAGYATMQGAPRAEVGE